MAGDTKERILKTALELFAQNGYLGTSMALLTKSRNSPRGML
ncbi:TetR family transcriptional regulator [Dysosmobacter sp.]